jgi:nitrous oxide reductase accessory protein NosL
MKLKWAWAAVAACMLLAACDPKKDTTTPPKPTVESQPAASAPR